MSPGRRIKQIGYLGGCATAVVVVSFLLVVASTPFWGGSRQPELPSPTPLYQPVAVEQVQVIRHGQSVDIVAQLRNPNSRAGVAQMRILFTLLDTEGRQLRQHEETTYLLPGSLAYVLALNVPVEGRLGRVQVDLPSGPNFSELPAAVSLPSFSTTARDRTQHERGGATVEEQRGIVRNTSTFDWQTVEVVGLAYDSNNQLVGAGKTFVGELRVGESREFTVQWPATSQATNRVVLLPSTNVYKAENVVQIIGDPGSLR